jgi:2-methylisocitrate lyase-like PEP mutase family enzyme
MCTASPLPVNIMVLPAVPTEKRLAELGVTRISHDPGLSAQMMRSLDEAARRVYAT